MSLKYSSEEPYKRASRTMLPSNSILLRIQLEIDLIPELRVPAPTPPIHINISSNPIPMTLIFKA